jgi:hypothetical protein
MPVKLINSDAKGFLRKLVNEQAKFLAEIGNRIPLGTPIPEKIQEALKQIKTVKSTFEELLANEVFWNESDEFPKLITDLHSGSNGDWNGNKIGSGSIVVKIRGKLVLFKNALFDVTGLYTK